jgi:hypothetical protein
MAPKPRNGTSWPVRSRFLISCNKTDFIAPDIQVYHSWIESKESLQRWSVTLLLTSKHLKITGLAVTACACFVVNNENPFRIDKFLCLPQNVSDFVSMPVLMLHKTCLMKDTMQPRWASLEYTESPGKETKEEE